MRLFNTFISMHSRTHFLPILANHSPFLILLNPYLCTRAGKKLTRDDSAVRGLVIWALAATLIAALPGNFHISTTAIATSTTTTTLKELDDATISLETIPEELNTATTTVSLIEQSDVVDDDTATPTWMVKPGRPTRTVVPDWITPPFNPVVDNPPYDPASQDLLAAYQALVPFPFCFSSFWAPSSLPLAAVQCYPTGVVCHSAFKLPKALAPSPLFFSSLKNQGGSESKKTI